MMSTVYSEWRCRHHADWLCEGFQGGRYSTLDLQRDALLGAGVDEEHVYEDRASGRHDHRPGLEACLKALQPGNTFVVWKLDRLGRNLKHLVTTVEALLDLGLRLHDLPPHHAGRRVLVKGAASFFGVPRATLRATGRSQPNSSREAYGEPFDVKTAQQRKSLRSLRGAGNRVL